MRWSFRVGTVGGISVRIHVTFLLFVAWIALDQWRKSGRIEEAITAVALALSVFGCVLLHELGHAFAARRYGIRTRDIVLLPIGGVARLERMPEKPSQEIRVAVAGPLVNVAIATVLWLLRTLVVPREVWDSIGPGALDTLLWINLVMIGFNLIPAFPMDGGRVLRALLAMRMTYIRATRIATWIGQGLAIAFGIAGVFLEPHMLVVVGLFVFLAAGEEYSMVAARVTMGGFPVRAAMATSFATLQASDTLRTAVDLMRERDQRDVPVLDGGSVVGVLSRGPLVAALERHPPEARVSEVLAPGPVVVADPLEALDLAFRRMLEARQGALPVMSDGQLVGIVTAENVADLMMEQGAMRRGREKRPPRGDRLAAAAPLPPGEAEPPPPESEAR